MSQILITGGSSGGASDDCTALKSDIPKGLKAVTKDSDDEVIEGTLELTGSANSDDVLEGKTFYNTDVHNKQTGTLKLTGSAQVTHVFNGQTFYSTDPKVKLTGTMTVNSIMSFNLAGVSGRQILFQWQNPTPATGKPFTGIFINYSTSGYPGIGGTRLYTGFGNNSNPSGLSQLWANLPALGTTYYFSAYAYAQTSAGDIYSQEFRAVGTTGGVITNTYTSSQNVTVPAGFTHVDIFCVGGGAGGSGGEDGSSTHNGGGGDGGGGGHTTNAFNIPVSSGQVLSIIIGAGGAGGYADMGDGKSGGATSVTRSGSVLCSANGGSGVSGGSGAGNGAAVMYANTASGGNGGSNGGAGFSANNSGTGRGTGQGYTTTAFSENRGTIYAAGGAGGSSGGVSYGGTGGNYGGGNGGNGMYKIGGSSSEGYIYQSAGIGGHGVAATGSGGGGGGGGVRKNNARSAAGGNGGSGVVIIRFK